MNEKLSFRKSTYFSNLSHFGKSQPCNPIICFQNRSRCILLDPVICIKTYLYICLIRRRRSFETAILEKSYSKLCFVAIWYSVSLYYITNITYIPLTNIYWDNQPDACSSTNIPQFENLIHLSPTATESL